MVEEIQAQTSQGGNGLNLKVGSKSLGLTGPIVIPVVCLLLVGTLGWIRSKDLKESLAGMNTHLQALYVRQEEIRRDLQDQTKEMLTALRDNRDVTGTKLQGLTEQASTLQHTIATQTSALVQHVDVQTRELTQRLAILSYNIDRPVGERLPLNVGPEYLPRPPGER